MRPELLYKPLSILLDQGADRIAGHAFERAYRRICGSCPPAATQEDATWSRVLVSAAIRASVVAVVTAAVDRAAAEGFRRLYGSWPA